MGFADVIKTQQDKKTGFGSVNATSKTPTVGFAPTQKADLTSSTGLKALAEEKGLGDDASRVLANKGESPNKIFSGGMIMDIFDVLNTLQYGVVGLLKGKGFKEGVKTRQSFSDKDALGQFGIPGFIGGVALDIAFDPLTYVGGLGLGKKALDLVGNVAGDAGKIITKAPVIGNTAQMMGDVLGRTFIYRFGQDPVYAEIAERSIKNIGVGVQNVIDIARPLTKLDPQTQKIIAEARKAGKLDDLAPEILSKARPAFDELDRLGKEAVEVGLLKKEIYDENVGSYIARLYRKYEDPSIAQKVKGIFDTKPLRIDLSRFMKRSDIPEEVRQAMGEILEAGYPTAKALVQMTQSIERARFFKDVSSKFAKETLESGFSKLPEVKTLGELAGKYVPTPIFDDIQEIIRVKSPLEKGLGKVVAGFKFGKVIMNPATHARNIMSNFILNNFEGLSPARLDIYGEAARQIYTKGDWYQEAQKVGLGLDSFAAREVKDFLVGPEVSKLGSVVKKAMSKMADFYEKEEQFAKMAQYIFQRKSGLSPDDAWKVAEKATFNYAQVTPFIRRLRESIFGYPFITFTYKATPQVLKTLITKPTKISNIGKIKNAIENQADQAELEKERASEPDWVRDGFYVKLPMKDKYGRSAYLDLSYILPFGDLVSGQFFERGIERESGLPEGFATAQIKKLPFPNLVRELAANQDFFGNKIFKESDTTEKQLADIFRHLIKSYAPPLIGDLLPGGYRTDGTRKLPSFQRTATLEKEGLEAGGAQTRTLIQELLRLVGIKISPVDLEMQIKFMEQEKRRALETLLGEHGITAQFKRTFVPAD